MIFFANSSQLLGHFKPDGTPVAKRPPTEFASFVRAHFAGARAAAGPAASHGDVMRSLSDRWREMKEDGLQRRGQEEEEEAAAEGVVAGDEAEGAHGRVAEARQLILTGTVLQRIESLQLK